MRSAKDFFQPLAIGAPMPPRAIPVKPSRMIHFFDPSNPKMAAKVPDLARQCDVLLGNLEEASSQPLDLATQRLEVRRWSADVNGLVEPAVAQRGDRAVDVPDSASEQQRESERHRERDRYQSRGLPQQTCPRPFSFRLQRTEFLVDLLGGQQGKLPAREHGPGVRLRQVLSHPVRHVAHRGPALRSRTGR